MTAIVETCAPNSQCLAFYVFEVEDSESPSLCDYRRTGHTLNSQSGRVPLSVSRLLSDTLPIALRLVVICTP